jgi:hypothetical protein
MDKRYFIFILLVFVGAMSLFSQTNDQENEYPFFESFLNTNFKNMTIESYKKTVEQYGLTFNENRQRSVMTFIEYRGNIDKLEVTIVGIFYDNDHFIQSIIFRIKRPNTPIQRFELFEKLNDYITVLYGDPSLSLFKSAHSYLNNRNNFIFHNGFREYASARNYKELIIQSESSLVSNSNYYNGWTWTRERNGFKDRVPGIEEGSAKIELQIDNIVIVFSNTKSGS